MNMEENCEEADSLGTKVVGDKTSPDRTLIINQSNLMNSPYHSPYVIVMFVKDKPFWIIEPFFFDIVCKIFSDPLLKFNDFHFFFPMSVFLHCNITYIILVI